MKCIEACNRLKEPVEQAGNAAIPGGIPFTVTNRQPAPAVAVQYHDEAVKNTSLRSVMASTAASARILANFKLVMLFLFYFFGRFALCATGSSLEAAVWWHTANVCSLDGVIHYESW